MILQSLTALQDRFEALGFRGGDKPSQLCRGPLRVELSRDWCTLLRRCPAKGGLEAPGLWKRVSTQGSGLSAFDLPAPLAAGDELDLAENDPLVALLEWAQATAKQCVPESWEPPPRENVEEWLGKDALTVQDGPFVVQGGLIYEAHRLAIRFPLVRPLPTTLSASRRAWVEDVLADAQDRWRMVRAGIRGAPEEVLLEVDLSGAPHACLEELTVASRDALRWVVKWTVWPIRLLCDPDVRCDAWETRV